MPIISSILYCTPSGTKSEPHHYTSKHFYATTVPTHSFIARKKNRSSRFQGTCKLLAPSRDDIFSSPTYAGPSKFVFLAGRAGKAGVPGSTMGARITRRHTHAHTCCSLCLLGRTGHRRQWARKTTALCRVHPKAQAVCSIAAETPIHTGYRKSPHRCWNARDTSPHSCDAAQERQCP